MLVEGMRVIFHCMSFLYPSGIVPLYQGESLFRKEKKELKYMYRDLSMFKAIHKENEPKDT